MLALIQSLSWFRIICIYLQTLRAERVALGQCTLSMHVTLATRPWGVHMVTKLGKSLNAPCCGMGSRSNTLKLQKSPPDHHRPWPWPCSKWNLAQTTDGLTHTRRGANAETHIRFPACVCMHVCREIIFFITLKNKVCHLWWHVCMYAYVCTYAYVCIYVNNCIIWRVYPVLNTLSSSAGGRLRVFQMFMHISFGNGGSACIFMCVHTRGLYRMSLGLWTGWLNSLDTKVNAFVFNKLPVTVTVTVTFFVNDCFSGYKERSICLQHGH